MQGQLRIGVSGWDYEDWKGPLYPATPVRGFRALPWLSKYLDFMEVNVSFYRIPAASTAERWLAETPPRFTFLPKVWKGWSHDGAPVHGEERELFREFIEPFAASSRLEGVLLQFPPSFRDSSQHRQRLEQLSQLLLPHETFLEVRHNSLYTPEFLMFVDALGMRFVNVDLPAVRQLPQLTQINTGPVSFTRLHGRNAKGWDNVRALRDQRYDYNYSAQETEEIVESLRILAQRVPKLLVAGNNHFRAQAMATVLQIKSQLLRQPVAAPRRLLEHYPQLEPFVTSPRGDSESPLFE